MTVTRTTAQEFFNSGKGQQRQSSGHCNTGPQIINTFLGVNSVNICRQWVEDGKRIPPDRLIEFSGRMFMHGISDIVNNKL